MGKPGTGRAHLPASVERLVNDALADPPWEAASTTRRESWVSKSRAVRVDAVTNEPDRTGRLIFQHPTGEAVAFTGHIDDPDFDGIDASPTKVAALPGRFALLTADDDQAVGYTAVHRMEPLYVAEGRDRIVLSTSARVAHRVSGLPSGEPPLIALIGLSGPGYMLNDVTPFPGVTAVPAYSRALLSPSGVKVTPLPWPDIDQDAPLEVVAGEVSDALVGAAARLASNSWDCTAHLTGGKDSRLAAVVLSTAGVQFAGTTTGVESHPDVIIGERVAKTLGVDHRIVPPAGKPPVGGAVEVYPLQRAHAALRGCEGMLSAYETIGLRGPYRDAHLTLGGHGGELLRGGFAYGVPGASPDALRRRLANRMAPHRRLLKREAQQEVDGILAPWADAIVGDPHRGSERLYREVRTGRWHAVANGVYSIGGPRRSLLADNQVVRLVAAMRQDLVAEERLAHAVLHRLRPDVCAIPLFSKRWRFEAKRPNDECDVHTWREREPPTSDQYTAWNWRVTYPPTLHRYLADSVLSAPLFDSLLDKAEVERFLISTLHERTTAQAYRVWSLFTASQLVAGLGAEPTRPEGPVIRIPVPTKG